MFAMTPSHGYELVQDFGLLLLGGVLIALVQRSENFVFRKLADRLVHRVPPEFGNIHLRQRYDFGSKINESMRWGFLIVAIHQTLRWFFPLLSPWRETWYDSPVSNTPETPSLDLQPRKPDESDKSSYGELAGKDQKQKIENRRKQEAFSKRQDEQIARRLVESPDLREAFNALRPQLRIVKGFLDGTVHRERAQQAQNRIVMISELRQELDELNKQVADLRNAHGFRFRAVDVWAALNDMAISPDTIRLRFPSPSLSRAVSQEYGDNFDNGALYSAQPKQLRINTDGFEMIDELSEADSRSAGLDTLLFNLRVHGVGIDARNGRIMGMEARTMLSVAAPQNGEYWRETIVQNARSYGFRVGLLGGDSLTIYIDLHSGLQGTASTGPYLVVMPSNAGSDRWSLPINGLYTTNEAPPSDVLME